MTTQQAKKLPSLKLHAAFSGAAAELLNSDVDVMGRGLEPVVLLYEGDLSPDPTQHGAGRVLAWDIVHTRESVWEKIPDPEYAGKVVVNFETIERSLNPSTLAAMGDLLALISEMRPKAKIGWYGHPRRFLWQWEKEGWVGEVDSYAKAWMAMMNDADGLLGESMSLLAPHNYPLGELVETRSEMLKGKYRYLREDMERFIVRQTRWVDALPRGKREVLWFVTPFVARTGDPAGDYTCNLVSAKTFGAWVKAMREGGAENIAIWMHAVPGEEGQLERVRKALVEVVFEGLGV